jgi:hypothetical protein
MLEALGFIPSTAKTNKQQQLPSHPVVSEAYGTPSFLRYPTNDQFYLD